MGEMEAGGGWGRDRMTAWRVGGAGSIGGGRAEVRGGWTKPGWAEAVVWSQGCGWGQQEDGGLAVAVTGARIWKSPQRAWVDRANGSTRAKLLGA